MASRGKDIEAASAYVRLYTKGGEWAKGLHAAGKKLTDFGQRINTMAKKLAIAGGAVAAPLVASVKAYVNLGSELKDVSERAGISVNALSELRFAADHSGSDIGSFEKALRKMQIAIADAANGSKTAKAALAAMGLESKDFIGLAADEQFEKVADALAGIPDTGERTAAALDLMGKASADLVPLLSQGAAGIREIREQAKALGLSISPEQAARAEALGDALDVVGKVVHRLAFSIGSALEPAVTAIASWFVKVVTAAREWIDRNRELVVLVAKLAAGVLVAAAVFGTLGIAIQFVGFTLVSMGAIVGSLAAAFSALGAIASAAIGLMVTPIGFAVTLLAGLAGYAIYASGALTTLAQGWSVLSETANTAWSGIVAAVAGGDLALAGEIAMSALEIGWLTLIASMSSAWAQFVDFFRRPWQAAVDWITDTMVTAFYALQEAWASVTNGIANVWSKITYDMTSAWDAFISFAEDAWQGFSTFFQQLWADILAIVDEEASNQMTMAITNQKTDYENQKGNRQQARDAKAKANQDRFSQQALKDGQAYQARLAQIDTNRQGMRETLASQRALRNDARNKPDPELEAKKMELAAKRKELASLSNKAKVLPSIPGLTIPEPNTSDFELTENAAASIKTSVSGAFSGLVAGRLAGDLGGGNPAERTARATEKTAKNTDVIKRQGAGGFT